MREITEFAGHAALTADGKRDPIFDGFTASGYRREYTLSELTHEEKREAAVQLLRRPRNGYAPLHETQAEAVVAAVIVYGVDDDLDRLIESATRP